MNKSVGVLKFRLVFLIFSKYLLVLLHLICYYIENFQRCRRRHTAEFRIRSLYFMSFYIVLSLFCTIYIEKDKKIIIIRFTICIKIDYFKLFSNCS